MSDFFKSEMVRGDLQEMMSLQETCFRYSHTFPALSPEKKLEYVEVLQTLIEKQKIFHARLKLSDDPEALEMANMMRTAAIILGGDATKSVDGVFDDLLDKVAHMRTALETGTEE